MQRFKQTWNSRNHKATRHASIYLDLRQLVFQVINESKIKLLDVPLADMADFWVGFDRTGT